MENRRPSYASVAGGSSTNLGSRIQQLFPPAGSGDDPRSRTQYRGLVDETTRGGPKMYGKGSDEQQRWIQGGFARAYASSEALTFFVPSYLRGTRYMEKLEAAYRIKLAKSKDNLTPARNGSGQTSLSTSSSSVNLHRMAPSHRGMTYDIVEHQPPTEDDGVPGLPSKWTDADRCGGLEVSTDGTDIRYASTVKSQDQEAAAARTDYPMPTQAGIYYYEVSLMSKGKEGMVGIGFSGLKASLERLPGWEPESWAYHGDDGVSFSCHDSGKSYGPTFTVGDVIGCGVNFRTRTGFFTKNGLFLGNAFENLKDIKVYPSIGMKRPGVHVKVNFGQSPFMFDIDQMMQNEVRAVKSEAKKADISRLSPPLTGSELKRDLISQFLRHDGYIATAKCFAEEVFNESVHLKKQSAPSSEDFDTESDLNARNRQQIRAAILDGDIDRALKLTDAYYPQVLQDHSIILFRLRCRKFIEMMRFTSTPAPTRKPSSKSLNMKAQGGATTDDVFEQAMDLDDMNSSVETWDQMETDDSSNRAGKWRDPLSMALKYAQELKQDYKDDRSKEVQGSLSEVFSLFAYADPRNSPTAHLLDPSERIPVAEELNSAILVSLGKSSSAAIERLCQQTEVLIAEITDHGGAGAFADATGDLLR